MNTFTALVLAGSRQGGDAFAAEAGATHKALIEVGGVTMIERVVRALEAVPEVERIVIAMDRPQLLAGLPGLSQSSKPVVTFAPAAGPSATTAAALERYGTPLLVTTADHALLQTQWVRQFLAACPPGADLVAALAPRAAVEAAAPSTRRTWLRFSDGDFSACNLFFLAQPAAARAVQLWQALEGDRKQPLRMVRRLGWTTALRYRLGWLSREAAASRLGRVAGKVRVALVELSDGRAAIDVDKMEDLVLVRQLAAGRPVASD